MSVSSPGKSVLTSAIAVIAWLGFSAFGYADIYRYINKEGVMCFTNVPTTAGYTVYIKEKPLTSRSGPSTHPYDHIIAKASDTFDISFSLIKAMIKAESDFDPDAVSPSGAMGLMQIMPENFAALNIDNPFDPYENIMAGSRFFKTLLKRYNNDIQLSVAAYNAGPAMVDRYSSVPPIAETREYVKRVLKYYDIFNREQQRLETKKE